MFVVVFARRGLYLHARSGILASETDARIRGRDCDPRVGHPAGLYKALQLWLEGVVSPYPDIDRAWKAGLEELDRQGIDLKQVPLFLVLGTSGLRQEKSLFEAARLELGVREAARQATPRSIGTPGPVESTWFAAKLAA